ncbi:hypothetical protein FK220_002255 [Flavobacteriaceae bacterium TP-CH-4]|uniref:DinB family protein n=1 Tax=Pelagihabitans pacificus TaxID=2696054 RepID=A0A967APP1_9FLAO|nr:hypothetical protein [Pelagihabitans pacificus]NHF58146.1 hypothetical protein [Pelagihabitans pacificus]
MKLITLLFLLLTFTHMNAQNIQENPLPYAEIPEAPASYTPGTVISRMIDGLGFRYHWATEGLTQEDLDYRPGNDGRTIAETMDHLYGLSMVIVNSAKKEPRDFTVEQPTLSMAQKRKATLENLEVASRLFRETSNLEEHKLVFIRANGRLEFPFWNNINGPIEDAIWHAGQVVVLRRSAGNPINPKVNVFLGKLND